MLYTCKSDTLYAPDMNNTRYRFKEYEGTTDLGLAEGSYISGIYVINMLGQDLYVYPSVTKDGHAIDCIPANRRNKKAPRLDTQAIVRSFSRSGNYNTLVNNYDSQTVFQQEAVIKYNDLLQEPIYIKEMGVVIGLEHHRNVLPEYYPASDWNKEDFINMLREQWELEKELDVLPRISANDPTGQTKQLFLIVNGIAYRHRVTNSKQLPKQVHLQRTLNGTKMVIEFDADKVFSSLEHRELEPGEHWFLGSSQFTVHAEYQKLIDTSDMVPAEEVLKRCQEVAKDKDGHIAQMEGRIKLLKERIHNLQTIVDDYENGLHISFEEKKFDHNIRMLDREAYYKKESDQRKHDLEELKLAIEQEKLARQQAETQRAERDAENKRRLAEEEAKHAEELRRWKEKAERANTIVTIAKAAAVIIPLVIAAVKFYIAPTPSKGINLFRQVFGI